MRLSGELLDEPGSMMVVRSDQSRLTPRFVALCLQGKRRLSGEPRGRSISLARGATRPPNSLSAFLVRDTTSKGWLFALLEVCL